MVGTASDEKLITVSSAGTSSSIWDVERLRYATDAAGVALWSWNVDTDELALDGRARTLWQLPSNSPVTFEKMLSRIYPADLDRVRDGLKATRMKPGPYEIDFRILHDQGIRWVSARGQGDDIGIVGRVMFGVFLDVTERRQAEEMRDLLTSEMTHRVKNLFAVASAMTEIAARSAETTIEMARDLTQRLTSLGRAHDLVRPGLVQAVAGQAWLGDLLTILLTPYDEEKARGHRLRILVPDVHVGQAAATALALVIHELATNSIKYGALSISAGTLDLTGRMADDALEIVWLELNGPRLADRPRPTGYGSKLIARSMSSQLGGTVAFEWCPDGAVITLQMSRACLAY